MWVCPYWTDSVCARAFKQILEYIIIVNTRDATTITALTAVTAGLMLASAAPSTHAYVDGFENLVLLATLADFVEASADPQTYVDRYNTDAAYKDWFDKNYADKYETIYDAVGLPVIPAPFVDASVDPQTYVDRYVAEAPFRDWFDANYPGYDSIYHAVGLSDPNAPVPENDAVNQYGVDPADLAPFVDVSADPQTYVDRYNTDAAYKDWFDKNYADKYETIYDAVGLPVIPAPFVDASVDPQTYVDRYVAEAPFRDWFDANYPGYDSIYHAVGLPDPDADAGDAVSDDAVDAVDKEPEPELPPPVIAPGAVVPEGLELQPGQEFGECGEGTELVNGYCIILGTEPPVIPVSDADGTLQSDSSKEDRNSNGGGCLIATAVYGSEMASQVQMLREIRDNQLVVTQSGSAFVEGFNHVYYSFSPAVADMEREHPAFRDATRSLLTPLLYTLGVMEHADSESKVLAYGVAVILANIAMYAGVPVVSALAASRYYTMYVRDVRKNRPQSHVLGGEE